MRGILRINWHDRVINKEVLRRTGQKPVDEEIGMIRWLWIGHTLRKPQNNITRQALQWNPQGDRGRDRPIETRKRCVEKKMKIMEKGWGQLGKLAQDRSGWHLLVRGLYHAQVPILQVGGLAKVRVNCVPKAIATWLGREPNPRPPDLKSDAPTTLTG
ncbi:hypothetical protein ElyMa_005613900 [Elysia marginata]|uniref:Uncharacterized protein n=1 Tax=Elysia marginata TaxID=1093978 RepID=A0AAV4F7B4_9GAST|nr:hypothetical protein ElyMa_005613900 [Elysia marginata]